MSTIRLAFSLVLGAAATGAPALSLAQEIVIQAEGGGETHTLFRKRIDQSSPLIAKALIERSLGPTGFAYTQADVAAIVGTATAKWLQWHKDFVVLGNCTEKSPSIGVTAPSGKFRYFIECRSCSSGPSC